MKIIHLVAITVIIQEQVKVDVHHVIMEMIEVVTTEVAQIVAMEIMDLAEI